MGEAEPKTAEPKANVLRRTVISPTYIKADAELQRAAAQYFSAIGKLSDSKKIEDAAASLKQKLVPKLAFDGEVDWRVIADERVKGGLIVEEIEKQSPTGLRD